MLTFTSLRIKSIFLFTVFALIFCGQSQAQSVFDFMRETEEVSEEPKEADPVKIFLDPGHGGGDLGAQGAKFILEKNITLNIARGIKRSLLDDERVEVVSSRLDDVEISVIERINMANASGAVLFIGIHADGARFPRRHPIKVFVSGGEGTAKGGDGADSSGEWETIQRQYHLNSMSLADEVMKKLKMMNMERGVDLVINDRLNLGGLAMPAILVEAVDLSNPEDELRLDDQRYLNRVASALSAAIIDFLEKSGMVKETWRIR